MSDRTQWLASDDNPDVEVREAWRTKLARKASGEPEPAGIIQQAQNAVGALGRVASAAIHGQAITVSQEEQERRLAICVSNVCGQYADGKCKVCGCVAKWKAKIASEKCPLSPPFW